MDAAGHHENTISLVGVRFRSRTGDYSSKEYTHLTTDSTIQIGDAVVVESDENFLFGIGFVSSTKQTANQWEVKNLKWIVQKITPTERNAGAISGIRSDLAQGAHASRYDDRTDTGHYGSVSSHDAWDYEDL